MGKQDEQLELQRKIRTYKITHTGTRIHAHEDKFTLALSCTYAKEHTVHVPNHSTQQTMSFLTQHTMHAHAHAKHTMHTHIMHKHAQDTKILLHIKSTLTFTTQCTKLCTL